MQRFKYHATVVTFGLLGSVFLVLAIDSIKVLIRDGFCDIGDQTGTTCFREWVSATSGWAAAIGALLAAYLTIRKLKDQIADQKIQTKHLIGDGHPILEIKKNGSRATIWIKNYNRRRMRLHSIENVGLNDINIKIPISTMTGSTSIIIQAQNVTSYFGAESIIPGWETPSSTLPNFKFEVDINSNPVKEYPPKLDVIFNWTLLDEFDTPIQLKVSSAR